ALEEAIGAHYDYMARKIAGIGGDSYLHEGALFAASGLHGILAGSDTSGVVRKSFKIGGKSLNLTTDAVSIRYAASRALTAERIAADFHSPDGQFESFDALGHYFTTALISLAAGNSPERAARHAFFAQVGDMLAPLDATATAVRAIATLDAPDIAVGLSLAVGEYSMNKVFGLQLRDTLASTYLLSKVIPKQTGPNLRGFGHEAMSRMCRLSALSPGGWTSEVPRLRAAFHVDVGVGLGTTAHSDEVAPAGVVRAGRAVVPAAVPVRYQRGLAGAVLPAGAWLL